MAHDLQKGAQLRSADEAMLEAVYAELAPEIAKHRLAQRHFAQMVRDAVERRLGLCNVAIEGCVVEATRVEKDSEGCQPKLTIRTGRQE